MQNASSFARLLRQAVEKGQVVLVPAPDRPPELVRPPPLALRDENSLVAALCLIFKLRLNEGRMLAGLMSRDYCTKEELRTAAAYANKTITTGTTHIFLSGLRKRLAPFDIQISTIPTLGYGLDGKARDKLRKMLVEHDRAIRPLAQSGAVEMTE
jgi:hypothetical protein